MRAAAIQLTATADPATNVETAERLVRAAAADGAQLVLLPEKWWAYGPGDAAVRHAEPLAGSRLVAWASALAAELGIDLVAGSASERDPATGLIHNTSAHLGPDGTLLAAYRKIHLFDAEVGGTAYRESDHEAPGTEAVVSAAADGTHLGLSVCYDLRFPELYRVLALRGARVLLVPAAFTLATTRAHWELLLRARAVEEGCFVVAANQASPEEDPLPRGGGSMLVDPWGTVVARAGEGAEAVVVADLDLDQVDRVRAAVPSLANRRPEAYAWPEPVGA